MSLLLLFLYICMGILVRSIKEIKKVEIDDKKTFLIFDKDKLYFEGIFMIMKLIR